MGFISKYFGDFDFGISLTPKLSDAKKRKIVPFSSQSITFQSITFLIINPISMKSLDNFVMEIW